MGTAAFSAKVKYASDSIFIENEDMSVVSGTTTVFQITDADRQALDIDVEPTFKDGGSAINIDDIYLIDYLFGRVYLKAAPTGAVTFTGNYMPLSDVVFGANSYTINITPTILDVTNTKGNSDGERKRYYGLHDSNVSLSRWDGDSDVLASFLDDRENLFVSITKASGKVFRGWYVIETKNKSGDIDALEGEELSLQLNSRGDTPHLTAFSWSDVLRQEYEEWAVDTAYVEGDIVFHNDMMYRCILDHTSATPASVDEPGEGDDWLDYWRLI